VRTSVRLDCHFGLRHYSLDPRLDRSTHGLYLDARLRLSRRWTLQLRDLGSSATFGEASRLPAPAIAAPFYPEGGPEVFHSRTIANTALADVIFAPSPRLSFSIGGDGFVIERQNRGLADAVGWRTRADIAWRYRRHRTLSLSYTLTRLDHTRRFGSADYAVLALGHSARLGPRTEFDLLAGVGQLRGAGIRAVQLDPDIARLLGTARGAEIYRLHTRNPHFLLGWTQSFGRTALRLDLARLVSDGGGLTGVARQNQASLALSAPLTRTWRLAGSLSARTYRSLDTLLYDTTAASAGWTLSRRLSSHTEAVVRYDYSFYHFDRGLLHWFHRHQFSLGVVYRLVPSPSR
jgi:hypothetical protein